jgi:autotransporter-associated beta strand protein
MKTPSAHRLVRTHTTRAARCLGIAIACLLATTAVQAANGTWITDGNGLWSDTTNWSNGTIADGSGSSANFSTLDLTVERTVSLDSARTLSGLSFGDLDPSSAADWILDNNGDSANVLTLGTAPTITVNTMGSGKGATIRTVLAGSTGLTKIGAGTLTLTSPNTYTGTTTIYNAGAIRIDAGSGGALVPGGLFLGKNSDYTGAAAFLYDNTSASGETAQTLSSLASQISCPNDNTVQLTRSAAQPVSLTFTAVTGNSTENGNVINFVTKDSAGGGVNGSDYKIVLADQTAYRITKQNAYFNGGDFAVYDTSAGTGLLGFVRGINYGVDPNSATSAGGESFAATYNQEITGSISAQPGVTLGAANNNGTLKIVGSSDLTMISGTLAFSGTGNTGAGGILKTGGGTSTLSGGSINLSGTGQGDIRVDGATDVLNIAMPLTFNGATRLLKSGAGTLILSGATTYNLTDSRNRFFINGGTLEIGDSAILNDTLGNLYLAPSASFKHNSSSVTSNIAAAINGTGSVTVSAGTLTLGGSNTLSGQVSVEAGTLKVAAVNNASANGPLGNSARAVHLGQTGALTGTLQYTGADAASSKRFTLTTGGFGAFQIDTASATLTLSGVIDGEGGLRKTGDGTLALSGPNTYSGDTSVAAGMLTVTSAFFSDASSVTIGTEAAATAVLSLNTAGATDSVSQLFIDGVQMPAGTYGSSSSQATHKDDATFSTGGDGMLDVLTGPGGGSAYDTWATAKGLSAANNGANLDPDNDGTSNLAEFAFNGNPLGNSDTGGVHGLTTDSDFDVDAAPELVLTVEVRTGTPIFSGTPSPTATIDGITYRIEGGLTLGDFSAPVNVVPIPLTIGLPPAGSGYEYRSFSLDGSNNLTDKGFLRAKVVK